MSSSDLEIEYERLRNELEQAYAEPVWNSRQIDRIANAIVDLEKSFMCHPILTEESQQASTWLTRRDSPSDDSRCQA